MIALLLALQGFLPVWRDSVYLDHAAWAMRCDREPVDSVFRDCMRAYPATAWPWAQQPASNRHYWPVTVEQVATTAHTHIRVTGRVKLVRHEQDGDIHIQLTGRTGFIVAEIVPSLPLPVPTVGQRITVYGISREDKEHHWSQCHPVERWEPAK